MTSTTRQSGCGPDFARKRNAYRINFVCDLLSRCDVLGPFSTTFAIKCVMRFVCGFSARRPPRKSPANRHEWQWQARISSRTSRRKPG